MDTIPFIEYFNSDMSIYPQASTHKHEITGEYYIDKDEDFLVGDSGGFLMKMNFIFINTHEFATTATHHDKYGKYTLYPKGSNKYNAFYSKEAKRRKKGLTRNCKLFKEDVKEYIETGNKALLKPLHITGDHYHYLNYGRLERTLNTNEKAKFIKEGLKAKTTVGFPRFWDGDYWNYKIDEFCMNNEYNLCKGKARRKGYSFKRGNQGANTLNLNRDVTIILAAYEDKYLTDTGGTAWMLKNALDWLENETYWWRGLVKEDISNIQLGVKKRGQGNKIFGWKSAALSVSLRANSSAAASKGALEVDFEESGINPVLEEAMGITESVTESGAIKRGIIRAYGTAGTREANWKDFGVMFYKPSLHKMMPFENIWDKKSRHKVCGFFHPQILNMEPFMDEHGNSLLEEALAYDIEDKAIAEKNKNQSDYMIYVGQRANSPAEAFRSGRDNIFTSPGLVDHKHRVEFDSDLHYWRDGIVLPNESGRIIFKTNAQLRDEGHEAHDYIEDFPVDIKKDIFGCIREFHSPYRNRNGDIPDDLYYISYDTVDKDKDAKDFIIKNSLNSIQVFMYPNNISNSPGDILVASYAGRPNSMEEADRIALYLSMYYNCKTLAEVNAGQTVANFRKWNDLQYLHRDPMSIIDRKESEQANAPYGIIIGGTERLEDGLRYWRDFLHTPVSVTEDGIQKYNYHYIRDLPLLTEILEFGGTGTFDRLSSAVVAMFQRSAYRTKRLDEREREDDSTSIWEEIDLYGMTKYIN